MRMENQEHYIGRSGSWDWNGEKRHWNIFVEIVGYNGTGGFWLKEKWRWNKSSQVLREEIKTLSFDQSQELYKKIKPYKE